MSSVAHKCFCLCAGNSLECSYPDPQVCLKCRRECEPPRSKKCVRLELSDVGNFSSADRFQFMSKEAEEDLQKGFVPENTQHAMQLSRSTLAIEVQTLYGCMREQQKSNIRQSPKCMAQI